MRWLDNDHLLQINQDSIVDSKNNLTLKLIEKGFVAFVASDAHNHMRPLSLKYAYQIVTDVFDESVANTLFSINPQMIIDDQPIAKNNYQAFKKGFFGGFK
ncbi:hypothetical protein SDC9_169566 [bioreactor metagenome]|uniref:Uncharacterized protein n=1 Tax=bioreactor metagenome TaxID=1076179 RepID=A0A645GEG0_9ZZZZ